LAHRNFNITYPICDALFGTLENGQEIQTHFSRCREPESISYCSASERELGL
jgi:hypothetical protein